MTCDTVVISDIHLGSPVCNREKVLKVLSLDFKRLIINGDLFDNYSFKRFNKKDWDILSKLRKLSKTHNIIFIHGNHDSNGEFMSAIMGMEFVEYYEFELNNSKFFLEHGDKYDHWIKHKPFITWFFTGIYYWLQRIDKSHRISRLTKKLSKSWIQAKDIVRTKFVEKRGKKYDVLMAGHTHHAEIVDCGACVYVNSGSFCEVKCSYIKIYEHGNFELIFV